MHNTESERVAVCLAGWYGGLVSEDRGGSLRQNLIDPLKATLLLALNYRAEDGCSSEHTCGLHERLAGLRPWERLAMTRRRTAVELAMELEQLSHWPRLLTPFNDASRTDAKGRKVTTFCKRKPDAGADEADGSPYHCRIAKGWANTFLMPVLGSPRGTALHDLRDASICLRELIGAEQAASRRFDRVVFSRLAHVWLLPHPPLSLLGGECVWMPHGVDGGGLTTRHAVLRRAAADAYLGRLDRILDGRVLAEHPLGRGVVAALSHERHLAAVLQHRNLSTCRFPPTAFLGCDNLTLGSLTGLPKKRRFPADAAAVVAAAAEAAGSSAAGSTAAAAAAALTTRLLEGRTHQEMDLVIEHALALALPGARFAPLTRSATAVAGGFWVLASGLGLAIAAAPAQKRPFLSLLTRLRKLQHPVKKTSSPLIVWRERS